MSKILVIGCGNVGSVGLHKLAQFPEIFSDIHVVTRTAKKSQLVKKAIQKKTRGKVNLKIHQGDVGDKKALAGLLKKIKPDLVIHWGHPYQNLVVMDACLENNVTYIDTACYENPKN